MNEDLSLQALSVNVYCFVGLSCIQIAFVYQIAVDANFQCS